MHNIADKSVRYLKDLIQMICGKKLNPEMTGFTWCDAKNDPKNRIDYNYVFKNTLFHSELTSKVEKTPQTETENERS